METITKKSDVCSACESLKMRVIDFGGEMDELNKIREYRDVTEMEMCNILGVDWCMMDREGWIRLATQLHNLRRTIQKHIDVPNAKFTHSAFVDTLAKLIEEEINV